MDIICYKKEGRFLVPDLHGEEPVNYGKYGQMRLDYLKEHRQDLYVYYLMKGILNQHLAETDVKAKELLKEQIKQLQKKYHAPNQNDTLAWTGYMNSLKQMAEEVVLATYVYRDRS